MVHKLSGQPLRVAVLNLIVSERHRHGLGVLKFNAALASAAQAHARDMADRDYFAHDTKDGKSWDRRIRAHGYRGGALGENIAYGQDSVAEVVEAWMDSPPHRANILSRDFTVTGIGFDPDGQYWVQDFGGE